VNRDSSPPVLSKEDLFRVDIRVGTILDARIFPEARKPAYQLQIDFGPLGIKTSSAQITKRYRLEDIIGRQIIAVVNLRPMRIANYTSEVLVLGGVPEEGDVVLLNADMPLPNGTKIS
jgi:tRNA-binding protein